jgi:hypothetical protein
MTEAVLVRFERFMESHRAILSVLLRREPAQDGVRLFAAWAKAHINGDAWIFMVPRCFQWN